MRSQQYDEINDASDTEAEHLLQRRDESSSATPHSPWRNVGVAMSVCGAVAFVLAVYSNPSAHGGSVANTDTELVKAMNDVSAAASFTPKPGAHDKARQHLINGDDHDDYEEEPEAMSSCGKGATCAPSPPPTWRAHDGVSPTVALTPFPTQSSPPTNPVVVHKHTPAPQPVWSFPTKAPTTSTPTLEPTPTPAPTHHKAPSYDWPTYEPTIVPTNSHEPTGNVHGNTPKPTHGNTPKPTHGNTPKPTHKHYEPTPAPTRKKKPAHGAPTQAPTLKPTHHKAPTPQPKDDTSSPTMKPTHHKAPTPQPKDDTSSPTTKPTHHKAPTPEPKAADDDDGTANARSSGHGHGAHGSSSSSSDDSVSKSSSSDSSSSKSHSESSSSGSSSGKSSGKGEDSAAGHPRS